MIEKISWFCLEDSEMNANFRDGIVKVNDVFIFLLQVFPFERRYSGMIMNAVTRIRKLHL